jgi:hypothetical protein
VIGPARELRGVDAHDVRPGAAGLRLPLARLWSTLAEESRARSYRRSVVGDRDRRAFVVVISLSLAGSSPSTRAPVAAPCA